MNYLLSYVCKLNGIFKANVVNLSNPNCIIVYIDKNFSESKSKLKYVEFMVQKYNKTSLKTINVPIEDFECNVGFGDRLDYIKIDVDRLYSVIGEVYQYEKDN